MLKLPIRYTWDGATATTEERVSVWLVGRPGHLELHVDAPLHGDPAPTTSAGPCWGLWEHEVVELFVLGRDQSYLEVELGPYGHHLVLKLRGRRNVVARELPMDYRVRREGERWRGRAVLPREWLPTGPHAVNATAIHGQGESRRYLVYAPMPGPAPDFHRLEHYVPVELPGG